MSQNWGTACVFVVLGTAMRVRECGLKRANVRDSPRHCVAVMFMTAWAASWVGLWRIEAASGLGVEGLGLG